MACIRNTILVIFCILLFVPSLCAQEVQSWEALRIRPFPQWFTDAKLGVFIHWGVYSVPAYSGKEDYGEWFLRGLQNGDSLRTNFMRKHYGEDFTYYDFAPLFKAELFDPGEWARLFKDAGARYVVLVSKHHDGYCLWPSRLARAWNSVDTGPKRDLVGELDQAIRKEGLRMGLYYSLAEWNNPLHRWYSDPPDQIAPYVEQYMIPQFKDLVSTYRPDLIFADGEWLSSAEQWHARELISWYYDLIGPDAIVNDRWGGGSDIGFLTPEYSSGLNKPDRPWAEVRGLGRSFALNRNEKLDAYLSGRELIHFFAEAVANGGGMILNVGPGADGQIPLLQQERLIQLGTWLKVNGEAIYGSAPWQRASEERMVEVKTVEPNIDFNWVRNAPVKGIREDDFSAIWEGYLEVPQSGEYRFFLQADDNAVLWLNDREVLTVQSTNSNPAQKVSQVMPLETGKKYPLLVQYQETKQNASAQLHWTRPDGKEEVIPAGFFTQGRDEHAPPGLRASYHSLRTYQVYTQKDGNFYVIALEWPEDLLKVKMDKPAKGMQVTLLGRDGALPWRYRDGQLEVEVSGVRFGELTGQAAWVFKLENKKE